MSDPSVPMPSGVTPTADSLLRSEIKDLSSQMALVGNTLEDSLNIDKKSLMEQKDLKEDLKEQKTRTEKKDKQTQKQQNEFMEKTKESLNANFKKAQESAMDAIYTPFSVLTEPLESLTGISLKESFSSAMEDIGGVGKKNPTDTDVQKMGEQGTGFLWLGNLMAGFFGKDDEMDGDFDLLGGKFNIGNLLQKAGGIAMIAGALIWGAMDAIAGWAKAEEWGTSQISAGIGGFLGGTGSGWENAFKNAGKFALMGAGIGLLAGGPVGALAGGLIGAALGGILGFIGGENLAKGFDAIGAWFVGIWESIVSFFTENELGVAISDIFMGTVQTLWGAIEFFLSPFIAFGQMLFTLADSLINIWSGEGDIRTKVFDSLKAIFMAPIEFLKNLGATIWDSLTNIWEGLSKGISGLLDLGGAVKQLWKDAIWPFITDFFGMLWKGIQKSFMNVMSAIGTFFSDMWDGISEFFVSAMEVASQALQGVGDFISWLLEPLASFIGGIFIKLVDGISFASAWIEENILKPIVTFLDPILAPMKDAFTFLVDGVVGMINGVLSFINDTFEWAGIHIPLIGEGGDSSGVDPTSAPPTGGYSIPGVTSVNDAIITKDGQVIKTHPNDNLIAVQDIPAMFNANSGNEGLSSAIQILADKVARLEPRITSNTNIIKTFGPSENITSFPRRR